MIEESQKALADGCAVVIGEPISLSPPQPLIVPQSAPVGVVDLSQDAFTRE